MLNTRSRGTGRFHYQIVCRSGVLCGGVADDFLALILLARARKIEQQESLPMSTIRVQLFYPNGIRVPQIDVQAALTALSDKKVLRATLQRISAVAVPGATTAKRAALLVPATAVFLVGLAMLFFQAGVVAPPEALIFESRAIFGDSL
jgi:hypothetical protein